MGQVRQDFLDKAFMATRNAGHILPEVAAREAGDRIGMEAVEAGHGGQQPVWPEAVATRRCQRRTLALPTREYLRKQWVMVEANRVKFASWNDYFRARMSLLERLKEAYPHHAAHLAAFVALAEAAE
jgi:hypothetical protein